MNPIEGLEVDVGWADGVDPSSWRNRPDPDGDFEDDDVEDRPCPKWVEAILGFDPDDL